MTRCLASDMNSVCALVIEMIQCPKVVHAARPTTDADTNTLSRLVLDAERPYPNVQLHNCASGYLLLLIVRVERPVRMHTL